MTSGLTTETVTAPAAAPAAGARQVWRRLRAQRSAAAGAVIVVTLVLAALAAPLLAAVEGQDTTTYHPGLVDSAAGGVPLGSFGGISADHWFGVEPGTGRDMFARIVYGARVSLAVAIGATVVQVIIGTAVGLAAGLGNRWLDTLLSRTTDIMIAMPALVFAIALMAVVPSGFPRPLLLMIIIGLVAWGGLARLVRGQTLSLKSLDHVAAARLSGWSTWRVALREIAPALVAPVVTYAALLVPANIANEAGLSFLGVGVRPPTPSWGQMLSTATTWYDADPVYVLLPAVMLFVTVLGFTLFGDGLRTAMDPRAASRLRIGTGRGREESGA